MVNVYVLRACVPIPIGMYAPRKHLAIEEHPADAIAVQHRVTDADVVGIVTIATIQRFFGVIIGTFVIAVVDDVITATAINLINATTANDPVIFVIPGNVVSAKCADDVFRIQDFE
jgi:hypothetical protein